jgi:hypothetical protein
MTSNFSNVFIGFSATPTAQFEVNFHKKQKKNAALTNHKKLMKIFETICEDIFAVAILIWKLLCFS